MKRNLPLKLALIGTLLVFLATNLFSQTNTTTQQLTMGIPTVQLINAVDTTAHTAPVSLELTTNIAGTKITGGTGTSYLQVSSIIATGTTNKIQASVTGVPAGTTLDLTSATPTSLNGDGTYGTGLGPITLSATAADVITGIGSCYTGIAPKDGYVLLWQWNAGGSGQYSSITATSSATATVTLTITAGP